MKSLSRVRLLATPWTAAYPATPSMGVSRRAHARTHARTHAHTHTHARTHTHAHTHTHSFPGGADGKVSACNAGDPGIREDPLEKEMATHSGTLAWKIPWMEEPGRLQSIGLQRVGHD